jgi:hypothetical protein
VLDRLGIVGPLGIVNELVIGETLLVERGTLSMRFGLRALAHRFLLRDPRAAFGGLGFEASRFRGRSVLLGGFSAPLLQLALTRPLSSPRAGTREREYQDCSDRDDDDDRDHNDQYR